MAKKTPSPVKKDLSKSLGWVYFGIISVAFFIIYQFIFDQKLDLGGDNAMYYILGKAINMGEGFKDIHTVAANPHTHFPPGYPAILGLFMFISKNLIFLKIVNGLFLYGTVLLVYRLLIKFTDNQKLAFVSALLILFNTHLLSYGTKIMSEVSFTFFTTLALFLFIESLEKVKFYASPSFYFLILTTSLSFHIRTVGIALVAGIVLFLLIKRNWKYLVAFVTGFGLLAIPWILRNKAIDAPSNYANSLMKINPYRPDLGNMEISDWFTRFFNNFSRYITKEIPNGLFSGIEVNYREDATALQWIVGLAIIAIVVFGLFKLKNYRLLLTGYLLGTFGILLLWPDVWYGIRFVLPVLPFLLFLFVLGFLKILEFILLKINIKKVSPYLGFVLVAFLISPLKALNTKANDHYPNSYKNYFELGNYVNQNLPQDVIISTRKPSLFYLYANRKVQRFLYEKDYSVLTQQLEDEGVTHVVIEQLGFPQTGQYLVPAVQANPEKFKNIVTLPNPDTYFLSFNNALGYQGQWKEQVDANGNPMLSVKEGKGIYVNNDGTVYEGMFKNNLPDGEGQIKNKQGQIIEQGFWLQGQKVENNLEN